MPGEPGASRTRRPAADRRAAASHRWSPATRWPRSPTREYGDPTLWRALAAFNGIDDPLRLPPGSTLLLPSADELLAGGGDRWRTTSSVPRSRSTARRCPPTSTPLLVSAYVDDSLQLPDLFVLRFRDPDRMVLAKSGVKIGSTVKISRQPADATHSPQPLITGEVTALEAEFDADRDVHRGPRLRPGAPAVPRPAHRDLHADDRLRHRHQGRPAGRADGRHGRADHAPSTTTCRQGGVTDWEFLRPAGPRDRLRGRRRGRQVRLPRAEPARDRTGRRRAGQREPAGAAAGHRPAAVPRRASPRPSRSRRCRSAAGTSRRRRRSSATAPAKTTSAELPTRHPADLAKTFGDPVYVATDVAVPHPGRGRRARRRRWPSRSPAPFAEFEGVARGNPKLRAGTADPDRQRWARRSTASTPSPRRGTGYDPTTGYTTHVRGDRAPGAQPARAGVRRRRAARRRQPGVVIAQVSDAQRPAARRAG